jgi:hypothetical protein
VIRWLRRRRLDHLGPVAAGHDAWWTIHGEELGEMLARAYSGENPHALYLEMYANAEHERP